MSPFKSLRRGMRALGVRALASMAVFCTLAVALIALTAGTRASAEATETGVPAEAADQAVAPEPVLGAEQTATAPADSPEAAAVAESAPAPEPAPPPEAAASPEPPPAAEAAPPPEPPAAPAEQQPEAVPAKEQSEAVPAEEPAEQPSEEPPARRAEEPRQDDKSQGSDEPGGGADRGGEPRSEESGEEPGRGEPGRDEEPVQESEPGEESDSGDESGWGEGSESGWRGGENRSLTRRPNLTGALGQLGGGGKDEGSGGGPVLNTLVGGSQTATIAPAPPSFDDVPISGEPEPVGTGTPGVPTLPTVPNDDLRSDRGGGIRFYRVSAPVEAPGSNGGGNGGTAGTTPGGTGAGTGADVGEGFVPAPAASGGAFIDQVGQSKGGGDGSANPVDERAPDDKPGEGGASIVRKPLQVVNKVPDALKYALAALGVLSVMLGVGYLLATMRARSLGRQRRELLQEVGLLQSALLPPVPEKLGSLRTSVAYRPADGPGAGGDFYDVLPLAGGSVGFILGDVSGHGRGALARTAFMRYTLRAYLEAGLEPRAALQVAGRVIDENLGGDFATVLLAVHDPETGSLTYATAGHPAPIVVGPEPHHPVTAGSSPPIGVGVPTGLRQTTVPLVPGAVACLFTDGLMDARVAGGILGRGRLEELLREMGDDASARQLIERVSQESRVLSDDIAAVVVSPTDGAVTAPQFRTEQLELSSRELEGPIAHRFLECCGVPRADADAAVEKARALAGASGAAILDVVFGDNLRVDVLPRDVDSIEAASRRAATG